MPWNGSYNRWIDIGLFQVFGLAPGSVTEIGIVEISQSLCQAFKFDSS